MSDRDKSAHSCRKCEGGNPWEYPSTLGYQWWEAANAVHLMLWAINDEYHIDARMKRLDDWLGRVLPTWMGGKQ
jgi:hypothetical protein